MEVVMLHPDLILTLKDRALEQIHNTPIPKALTLQQVGLILTLKAPARMRLV